MTFSHTSPKKYLRIRGGVLLAVCCIAYLQGDVFAQANLLEGVESIRVEHTQSTLETFATRGEMALKVLYMVLWPLLAITGAAMDNSLVYGGVFHLTEALFRFWQILRTFANFTLGFFFVGSIVAAFFGYKRDKGVSWIRDLVKKVGIAAIALNLSRWMFGALIDLSTVATITLGGLPLHALDIKDDKIWKESVYYLKPYSNRNLSQANDKKKDTSELSLMFGCDSAEGSEEASDPTYYLPCPIKNNELFPKGAKTDPTTRENYKETFIEAWKEHKSVDINKISNDYCVYDRALLKYDPQADLSQCKDFQALLVQGREEGVNKCTKVNQLLTKATGNTGPLFALFGSVLNTASLGVTSNIGSVSSIALALLIKTVFGLALIIPLLALAVIMVVRVVILWLIITFSPVIILAMAFGLQEKLTKINGGISIGNIISLIFLPAFASFGIGMSIIFLSLLSRLPIIESQGLVAETAIEQDDACYNDAATAIGLKRNQGKYSMGIGTSVTFEQRATNTGSEFGSILSWMIVNGFGVAMMWMVIFATLKTNKFTNSIVDTIESTAKSMLGNVPIIPINGGIGMNAMRNLPGKIEDNISNVTTKQYNALGLEDKLKDKSDTNQPEVKTINEGFSAYTRGKSTTLPRNIESGIEYGDFNDYPNAVPAYVKDAKEHFTKTNPAHAATISANLDHINTWEEALKNKNFVQYMQDKNAYDNFSTNRDKKQAIPTRRKNATTIENGLAALGQKIGDDDTLERAYLYDDKLTQLIFEKDKTLSRIQTTSLSSDLKNISADDISGLQRLLTHAKDKAKTTKLYSELLTTSNQGQATVAIKDSKMVTVTVQRGEIENVTTN